ncbi:uncharacterized protein M6B38_172355 [Iris pallida]|uniref:Patellin-3 n=1 Tax=Iris pallida TaxID=29817 RepID=A0AAX6ESZ8_IRIPA|nr:uncharacterized protein M6B38_172355 [Iris pallida]
MAQETDTKPAVDETPVPSDAKKPSPPPPSKTGSFREESNLVSDLHDHQKKALDELRSLLRSALDNNEFSPPPQPPSAAEAINSPAVSTEPAATATEEESPPTIAVGGDSSSVAVEDDGAKTVEAIESTVVPVVAAAPPPVEEAAEEEKGRAAPDEVSIWRVPLLGDSRSDAILLKFLRARDFSPKDALSMIKNTVLWRREFGIDALAEEDLGVPELGRVVYYDGVDREGHPVCYNVYGEFQNKEMYEKAFGDEEKSRRFLRWRIQYLEKGIREMLDFSPGGVSTMVQVTDLRNSPGLLKAELRQALYLLQDNYPEFVAKQVFINVPWWYLAFNKMISPFLTQRTKSKFVFAGPSKSLETLFHYIAPEQVPVQFGGLSKEKDSDFTTADAVNLINMKPSMKQIVEIPVAEKCLLVWELRVVGWDVALGAEFVPSSEDGYTVIIDKKKKLTAGDEPVVKNSFKINEPGKVVLTVENSSSKKKKLLYRYKAKSSS